ncbi:MAG: VOC family protein [Sphingomonadaceae bacterium]
MTDSPVMSPISPHLVVDDAAAAIDFYKSAFGAEEMVRLPTPDGRLMHACVRINGATVMLIDHFPEWGGHTPKSLGGSPVSMHLIVDDADAAIARAEAAGARVVQAAHDTFWGDRFGAIEDPFGHHWTLAHTIRAVEGAELQAAADKAVADAMGGRP